MRRMIDAALKNRIAVIAAVGNHGPKSPPLYRAAFPGVVGVTAIDDRRSIYAHANRGAYIALAAPGVDLLVPAPGGRQIVASGTSLAAAEVSGLLVLVLARNRQANGLSAAGWLLDTPTDLGARGRDPIFGFGLANGCAALGKGLGKPVPCP
jgi:subtilisin family serine protease